nr:reverse transcriptase domain-containing protein [Tanacetum cinerariifolium]
MNPVEIHHIKQKEGESMKAFMKRFKTESMNVNGAPECMRIYGFMHGITNPDLIKRLNDNIPKSVDKMMSVATAFLWGEVVVANQSRKKAPTTWRHHETAPPPMSGPAESQNKNKFCEFHGDKGHNTDECIHLQKLIEEAIKSGQLLHLIKELKQGGQEISFPPFASREGQENPIVIETKVEGHLIHRDGEHSMNALMNFMVVRSPSPYNGIIGRPDAPSEVSPNEPAVLEGLKLAIHPEYPEQTIMIGEILSKKGKMELCDLLKKNLDIFARNPADMTGVPRSIAEHRLNICEGCPPIRQKRRGHAPDQNKAIQEEVTKLVEVQITR